MLNGYEMQQKLTESFNLDILKAEKANIEGRKPFKNSVFTAFFL